MESKKDPDTMNASSDVKTMKWFEKDTECQSQKRKIFFIQKCPSVNRIRILLNIYNKSTSTVLSEFIFNSNSNYNLVKLFDDFHHILDEHDNELESIMNYMNDAQIICNDTTINSCKCLLRNYRDRRTFTYDETNEDLISLTQKMDLIHSYIFHSFHLSYRLTKKQLALISKTDKKTHHVLNVFDESFDKITKIIHSNNLRVNKLIDRVGTNSKFVTNLTERNSDNENDEQKNKTENKNSDADENENSDENEYSFGKPFKYWQENKFDYWFIGRKYSSIKSEILVNKMETITKEQFDIEYKKAVNFKQSKFAKKNCQCHKIDDKEFEYCSAITINHILSILFYCNYTKLCTVFSSTFRKLSKTETNECLKERNREYANMSKLLHEAVNLFGEKFRTKSNGYGKEDELICDSWPKSGVFHGISNEMLFSHSSGTFYGPLSTTTKRNIAIGFTNNNTGIMLQLNIWRDAVFNTVNVKFFRCAVLSDFTAESEYLFLQVKLNIDEITLVRIKEHYGWFNKCIQVLQKMLKSEKQRGSGKDMTEKNHLKYINHMIEEKKDKFPIYTNKLFDNVTSKIYEIKLNLWLWKKAHFYGNFSTYYGYAKLANLFITNETNNSVDLIKMKKLCKNCQDIHIFSHDWSKNGARIKESVLLTESFLKYLLSLNCGANYLFVSTISNIFIYIPNEKILSITDFVEKYKKEIEGNKEKYSNYLRIKVIKKKHPHPMTSDKQLNTIWLSNPNNIGIYECIEQNEFEQFKKLLVTFDINKKREIDGNNMLLFLVKSKKFKFLNYLLTNCNKRININDKDNDGMSALNLAVCESDHKLVKLLIHFGADLNVQNNSGDTALHFATKNNDMKMVKILLFVSDETKENEEKKSDSTAATGDPNILNNKNRSPLYIAAYKHQNFEILNLLIVKGNYSNWKNDDQSLFIASFLGNIEIVKNILENNEENINKKTEFEHCYSNYCSDDETALHTCCRLYSLTKNENYFEIIKLLIEKQQDAKWIDIEDFRPYGQGRTCIWYAATMTDLKLFNLLIKYNPTRLNQPNREGILFKGYSFSNDDITYERDYMLAIKNMKIANKYVEKDMFYEASPLSMACLVGNNEIITYLLQQNVDIIPSREWYDGFNSIQLCAMNGNIIGLQLIHKHLLKYKTKKEIGNIVNQIRAGEKSGLTAFHLACLNGHLTTIQYLVNDFKVDVNIKDTNEIRSKSFNWKGVHECAWNVKKIPQTGLDYAKKYNHKEVVAFLSQLKQK